MYETRVYKIWQDMKARCKNKNLSCYKNYGGRGIKVCERWKLFINFFEDMGAPPTDSHCLDRVNNDGHYCKENCRWTTQKSQMRNMRRNHLITHNGETKCLQEWADIFSIPAGRLRHRFFVLKWPFDKSVSVDPYQLSKSGIKHPSSKIPRDHYDKIMSMKSDGFSQSEIAKHYGVTQSGISHFLKRMR